ncbi:hypothetical protein K6Y81_41305, partial [Burkholderia cenocepacia]|nr:hypothetical protein [Burkholderia cenocepacia]
MDAIFDLIGKVFNPILEMGGPVIMLIILTVLALLFGVKFSKALEGGIKLAIALTGIGAIIGMLNTAFSASLAKFVENTGIQLSITDVGWAPLATITWGYTVREVVDEVFDSRLEISLKDALAINSAYELGDKIKFEEAPAEFGRVAAQSAKQTIMEKMRKQTRAITYNTYKEHEQEIMSGTVERFDNRFIYVNLGSIEAQLSKQDQIPGEVFASHDRIEVYVYKVEDNPRGVNVFVSRSHPEMIKRLMEQEIPEVYDGTVEIMSVAREAGDRTKVAVRSHNPNVDAIGTIVGRGGANIKKITSKFHPARYDAKNDRMVPIEENIDVIE